MGANSKPYISSTDIDDNEHFLITGEFTETNTTDNNSSDNDGTLSDGKSSTFSFR